MVLVTLDNMLTRKPTFNLILDISLTLELLIPLHI